MKQRFFVTGIGTDVGKTIVSAILTEALTADYWKPIQAGDLQNSDTDKVRALISNDTSRFHPNSFALKTPMSPHTAAHIDGLRITAAEIREPETLNDLVIEGAGGLLVPINDRETVMDLIEISWKVIVVSRHYLGSINHTLMTIETLKKWGFVCFGIIFSGKENPSTEDIIQKMTGVPIIGRVDQEPYFDKAVILQYAEKFRKKLMSYNND